MKKLDTLGKVDKKVQGLVEGALDRNGGLLRLASCRIPTKICNQVKLP